MLKRISHVRRQLSGKGSGKSVDVAAIRQAQADKGLYNPVFSPYRRVLDLAETIIRLDTALNKRDGRMSMSGLLLNVAELFEICVGKLLALHFPEWSVSSPAVRLHEGKFYERRIIPDIVMEHDDGQRVAVLDTEYKRMHFRPSGRHDMGDLDREDFFQIAAYMSYYKHQRGKKLVLGGLLYPLTHEPQTLLCHDSWMGDESISFIVDGVAVPEGDVTKAVDVLASERRFISRLTILLEGSA